MTKQVIKVAKLGISASSVEPNDFVFHSDYNTFKILEEGTKTVSLTASTADQTFSQSYESGELNIPIVSAFARRSGASRVFAPNGFDVEIWGAKLGMSGDITFNYVEADSSNIYFNFDNDKTSAVTVYIRYFVFG